jgi:hypothetical protein
VLRRTAEELSAILAGKRQRFAISMMNSFAVPASHTWIIEVKVQLKTANIDGGSCILWAT